ncbi:MAG TPA: response regulator [Terriglobales bacterium]|nr:response regulator [Terriglobales bacterium]
MLSGPVLLVEDDPSDFRLIQRAFNKLPNGFEILRLTNGDDAVAYLSGDDPYENRAAHPMPSLVLLDLKLPRRSGFEVLQWLRRQPAGLCRMPVVVLTSSRHTADINRAYDLGANSYLVKPETGGQLDNLASEFRSYWLRLNEFPSFQAAL